MIASPNRYAQVFASEFAWIVAEANSSKKSYIRPEQMSGAISGYSLMMLDRDSYLPLLDIDREAFN